MYGITPLGGMVVSEDHRIRAREWTFKNSRAGHQFVECLRIVGPGVRLHWTTNAQVIDPPEDLTDRSTRVWTRDGQRVLHNLVLGIAGAGGVAGFVGEGMARTGVGTIIQADHDTLDRENLQRASGATLRHVGWTKVRTAARWLRRIATARPFRYVGRENNVQESLSDLLDCDIIVSAVDGYVTRSYLNDLSYRFLIPMVDCGTEIRPSADGKTVEYGVVRAQVVGPGHACLRCTGFLTRDRITQDLLPEDVKKLARYGLDDVAPSLFFTNMMAVSLVGLLVFESLLGITSRIPAEVRYNITTWNLSVEQDKPRPGCACQSLVGLADHDEIYPSTADSREAEPQRGGAA